MNGATYAFTLVCAHLLGPADYGAVAALLGLVILANVVSLGLQATGARRIAAYPQDRAVIEARLLRTSVRLGLGLGVAALVLSPGITALLGLDSVVGAALLAVPAVCFTIMGAQAGILQGARQWGSLAAVLASLGIARLALGTLGVAVWPSTLGAMATGVALASVVPVLVGTLALRRRGARLPAGSGLSAAASGRTHASLLREVGASSHALVAFFALATVDVVLARALFAPYEAGVFAAGLILVKGVLFLPQFVSLVAFPALARRGPSGHRRLHAWGLGVIAVIGGSVSVVAALRPDDALLLVGGSQYAAVADSLWLFALVGTLLAAIQLLVYGALARLQRRSIVAVWAATGVIVLAAPLATDALQLVTFVAVVDAALLAVLVGILADIAPLPAPVGAPSADGEDADGAEPAEAPVATGRGA